MGAKSVCDASGKIHEFMLALKKAGFDDRLIQRIINSKDNKLAKVMLAAVTGGAQADDRFELVNTFGVVVPQGYDHATRLDSFRKEHRKEFFDYSDDITDANYAKATTKLAPGRKLKVKVFQIKGRVTSQECLAFLRLQDVVLVGAQGASLAYEQGRGELPADRWAVSFDEKDALWKDTASKHRVPRVLRFLDDDVEFSLGAFEINWSNETCLLCFCDDESSDA